MYQFSRAIYRELVPLLEAHVDPLAEAAVHARLLSSCESAIERLALDRRYFARPARTLFSDVRWNFPVSSQERVYAIVAGYLELADEFLAALPLTGIAPNGERLHCRALTRRGTHCQRTPCSPDGYCPSHQHLAETEETEAIVAA